MILPMIGKLLMKLVLQYQIYSKQDCCLMNWDYNTDKVIDVY